MITDPCITVIMGGFVADGVTPDGDGICWTVQKLDGWFDSTAIRVATVEMLPWGEVVTVARENARPIALTLLAHTADGQTPLDALCFTAMDSIDPVFPPAMYATLSFEVIDPVLDLFAAVQRVGSIQKRILGNLAAVRFLVPLLAADPYRYDVAPGVGSTYD